MMGKFAHNPAQWSSLYGVRHPIIGVLDITYGILINILYIPIISFMSLRDYFRLSCFKIMIFLGVFDMLALSINSILNGYLAIQGAVFCTHPRLIYISGMTVLGVWCCSCIIALLLVVNRFLVTTRKNVAMFLFEGNRTFLILTIPIIYGIYFMMFTTPVAFHSKYLTWLFDPLIFEGQTDKYTNIPHGINNVGVVAVTGVLYIALYFVLGEKMKAIGWSDSGGQDFSIQLLVQSAMLCSINMIASITFVLMNFVPVPVWLFITTHKMWQLIHGAPVFIYLCLNRTIRRGFMERLGLEPSTRVGNATTMIN